MRSRMPDAIRRSVLDMAISGAKGVDVARTFGCTPAMVSKVLKEAGRKGRPRGSDRTYTLDNDFWETVDTEAKAYWLGFLATDGCVSRAGDVILSLSIRDKGHLEKYREAIGSSHPIKTVDNSRGYSTSSVLGRFSVTSKKMAADLIALGIVPAKTKNLVPWDGPSHLMRHYWRGCVDGDGTVFLNRNGARWTVGFSGTEKMCRAFSSFVNHQTKLAVTPYHKNGLFHAQYCGKSGPAKVATLLYEGATVFLDRKNEKIQQLLRETANASVA